MAVRIRMKKMGRKHQPFFRICATDVRAPRDGRVIEELGTYDPSVPETDARCTLNGERVQYWLGVGAQPSEKVGVLIGKYGLNGTHIDAQAAARARLAAPKKIADPGEPAFKLDPPAPAAPKAGKTKSAKVASDSAAKVASDSATAPTDETTPAEGSTVEGEAMTSGETATTETTDVADE